MTLGYLVPEFPGQTHAFFWREINAIEESGRIVRLYSTQRPPAEACPHDFAPSAVARVQYLFPPSFGAAMRFGINPQRLKKAASYISNLRELSGKERLKVVALIPSALTLVSDAKREGVTHLHIHSCANSAHLGALANILGDLPYSLTLHGDLSVYGKEHPAKMRRATFVSAVTKPLADQVRSVSPLTDVPVIWMGVDCEKFAPDPQRSRRNPVFTVATVARLNHMKGHRFFLRAMAMLRDKGVIVNYKIAGSGPEESIIRREIVELALEDQVEMLGGIEEMSVLKLLQGSDALALTSIGQGEAAPVTVMEAMSCGLPVVCSIIGGTADMITNDDDGFLVEQGNVEQIADRISTLAKNPDLAAKMGAAARSTALKNFDYRKNAGKLATKIFPDLCGET